MLATGCQNLGRLNRKLSEDLWTEISHYLGLQKSTANQIWLNEMVALDIWKPEKESYRESW